MSAVNWVNIIVINNMMRRHFCVEIFWKRLVVIIWDKYSWQHISHFWWHSFTSTPCVEIRKYLSVICRLRVDTHRDKWTPFAEALAFVNLGRDNVYAANYTRSTTTFFMNALIVDCINWVPFIQAVAWNCFVYTEKKISKNLDILANWADSSQIRQRTTEQSEGN